MALGLPKRYSTKLAAFAFFMPALAALWLWSRYPTEGGEGYHYLSTVDTGLGAFGINFTLGLNGISLPMFLLAAIVGLAAGLYALRSGAERLKLYLILLLIMQGGLLGVFASVDIFLFLLLPRTGADPDVHHGRHLGWPRPATMPRLKLTIYLTAGAMLSLLGLIAIYVKSGAQSFDLITLKDALATAGLGAVTQKYIFGLLLFGFGILVSLWPFHTWAPLGYGAAPKYETARAKRGCRNRTAAGRRCISASPRRGPRWRGRP